MQSYGLGNRPSDKLASPRGDLYSILDNRLDSLLYSFGDGPSCELEFYPSGLRIFFCCPLVCKIGRAYCPSNYTYYRESIGVPLNNNSGQADGYYEV